MPSAEISRWMNEGQFSGPPSATNMPAFPSTLVADGIVPTSGGVPIANSAPAAATGGGAAGWISGNAMPLMMGIDILAGIGSALIQYWFAEAQNAFKKDVAQIAADVKTADNKSQVTFGKMLEEGNKKINANRHESAVGVAKTRGENAVTLAKVEEKKRTKLVADHRPVRPYGSPAVEA